MKKPILCVCPDGAMRDLVAESGLGVLPDPDDASAVGRAIEDLIREHEERGIARSPNEVFINRFERRVLTEKMARIIRCATEDGHQAPAAVH
jgi:hypothetical protein